MTPRQSECLRYITVYIATHGYSPNFEEIKSALKLASKSNVFRLLECLERAGKIRRLPNRARSIEVIGMPRLPLPPRTSPNDFASILINAMTWAVQEARRRGESVTVESLRPVILRAIEASA